MRWGFVGLPLLGLVACEVDGADLEESNVDAKKYETLEVSKATLTKSESLCDCKTSPCNKTRRCQGPDGDGLVSQAGGNPEGHEGPYLLGHGELWMKIGDRGELLVSTDEKGENLIATLDGMGGVDRVVAYEMLDDWTGEVGTVGVMVYSEAGDFNMDNLGTFFPDESGYR
jgi:hypothetical protein